MDEIGNIKSKINIRNISPSIIIKNIFSFLSEKQKLNMIMYNKLFQNLLLVDIKNYKKISGKYKISEKNGRGKEYLIGTNKLIFEGEYLNGKRNGKGKEYYSDDKLMFKGEYLNGKRWNGEGYNKNGIIDFTIKKGNGKGKEYNYDGELMFEGKYLNGERNGIGIEYYKDSELKFKGEYLNGERNGKGRILF